MLGLPSTTEVGRRLPKDAFYRNLKLDAKTRHEFVHLIESITIANSAKPSTVNIDDGKDVHEILVLDVRLKGDEQPTRAIEAIAKANPHKLVFRTEPSGVVLLMRRGLRSREGIGSLSLIGGTLDDVWDSVCAQVALGEDDGHDLDLRLERARRLSELEAEVARLDAACRKARQMNKKNELFAQLRSKRRELAMLGGSR